MDVNHEQLRNKEWVQCSMNCVEVHDGPDGHHRGTFIDTKSAWLDANMPSAFADGSA